ncbi:hypothetical protein BGW80DRAFT_1179303 [Lactifluus volemus]|nr:hypothetical protein BGW80DRAFT_1179303 [Lactifluus volemus]
MYPPNVSSFSPANNSSSTINPKNEFPPSDRISRTPSPTPSEAAELARTSVFDWKTLTNWRFWIRREWLWYYVIAILLTVITALITIYHRQIVDKLTPAAHWMKDLPGGWSIPIAILFIISFPPLFGHEIVAILCGIVWGLWIGFAIVAAGTFLGELGNFYAFKYCCHTRGDKLEKTNLQYGCLAHVVREGGIKIALVARFSAIPGHFTTAVFATCGMNVLIFSIAAFLSLPKQFATVYIGVIIEGSTKQGTASSRAASYSLVALTTIVTIAAAWYIYRKLNQAKPAVIYRRRKDRQAKMELARSFYRNNDSTVSAFNQNPSDSDIPLHSYDRERDADSEESMHQRWDENGHAIGHVPDPRLHAPRARPPSFRPSALYASPAEAVAVTASRDPDDEWSNARTPTTARPPEVASVPVIAPPPNVSSETGAYVSPSSLTSPSFRQPQHSPGMPSSPMAPYVPYQPDHFAAPDTARDHYFQPAMGPAGPTSTEPPKLSPPPTYQ